MGYMIQETVDLTLPAALLGKRFNAEVCLESDQTISQTIESDPSLYREGNDHLNADKDRTKSIHFHTEIPS